MYIAMSRISSISTKLIVIRSHRPLGHTGPLGHITSRSRDHPVTGPLSHAELLSHRTSQSHNSNTSLSYLAEGPSSCDDSPTIFRYRVDLSLADTVPNAFSRIFCLLFAMDSSAWSGPESESDNISPSDSENVTVPVPLLLDTCKKIFYYGLMSLSHGSQKVSLRLGVLITW